MGVYKFPLQKLLDIRKDKEEESKRNFKQAQIEKEEVEQKIKAVKEDYRKYNTKNIKETVPEQRIKMLYLESLRFKINQLEQELIEKKKIIEIKRADLMQKQIQRKTVEVLKDKKQAVFYKELDRIEQINNDEFALYGFIRNIERR